jgi:4,5-dihydroxyphthalate decarboxylase
LTAEFDATREGGVEPNRKTLELMARYSHEQGLAVRRVSVEEMFAPNTLNDIRV